MGWLFLDLALIEQNEQVAQGLVQNAVEGRAMATRGLEHADSTRFGPFSDGIGSYVAVLRDLRGAEGLFRLHSLIALLFPVKVPVKLRTLDTRSCILRFAWSWSGESNPGPRHYE